MKTTVSVWGRLISTVNSITVKLTATTYMYSHVPRQEGGGGGGINVDTDLKSIDEHEKKGFQQTRLKIC